MPSFTKTASLFLRAALLIKQLGFISLLTALVVQQSFAANLPEDRADIMFHSYDGGGIEISGPSVLVRKSIANSVSVYGNYYVDQVSSASIDVITSGASAYKEERTEVSVGGEYLRDKTTIGLSGTQSTENDYDGATVSFDITQQFFGDMSTLSLGFSQGDDIVRKKGDDDFEEELDRRRFRLGFSQVLTQKWLLGFSAETITDQGYLNNPYRIAHFYGASGASFETEKYPNTRNSDAVAIRTIYYLPYRASIKAELRNFADNWGIKARNLDLRYLHPYGKNWTFKLSLRGYTQTQADFYSDLFKCDTTINCGETRDFFARDKEMSEFDSISVGVGVHYKIDKKLLNFIDHTTVNLQVDQMQFDYANFRDATGRLQGTSGFTPGEEPLYKLDATVIRFFVSVFY